jgi:uncharacterized membrane protein YfcA
LKIGIIGAVAGLCNGLFGSGGGIIVVPSMIYLLKVEEHDAHATAIAVILPLSLASILIYFSNNYFDWNIVWKVCAGSVLGAGLGARLLPKIPVGILSRIFAVFMIMAGLRMLFR